MGILLHRRDSCYRQSGLRCYSAWQWYGRWIVLGILVVLFIIFLSLCLRARQRRRKGAPPMYGTGWMAMGRHGAHQQNQWYGPPAGGQQGQTPGEYGMSPPKYAAQDTNQYGPQGGVQPQYTGTTFNTADGYYGGHNQQGVQPPQQAYQPAYSPPAGPPPARS